MPSQQSGYGATGQQPSQSYTAPVASSQQAQSSYAGEPGLQHSLPCPACLQAELHCVVHATFL